MLDRTSDLTVIEGGTGALHTTLQRIQGINRARC
jgi:hypothetical protein